MFPSCDDFSFYDLIDDSDTNPQGELEDLSLSPISATIQAGADLTFTAAGGKAPYVFVVVSGDGTIDPSTGIYTAPVSVSVDIVRVTDTTGASLDAQVVVVE